MNIEERKRNFIKKAEEVHKGENLNYSEVYYITNKIPEIIDPVFGPYFQTPSNHLKGQGHPLRKNNKISKTKRSKGEDIIKRFEEVHKGEDLDYSEVEYVNMHTKVKIIDPEYGEYWQEPAVHLKGCGHPERGKKHYTIVFDEKEINGNEVIEIRNFIQEKCSDLRIIERDKEILNGRELDIYIPEKKLAIEYNGLK